MIVHSIDKGTSNIFRTIHQRVVLLTLIIITILCIAFLITITTPSNPTGNG